MLLRPKLRLRASGWRESLRRPRSGPQPRQPSTPLIFVFENVLFFGPRALTDNIIRKEPSRTQLRVEGIYPVLPANTACQPSPDQSAHRVCCSLPLPLPVPLPRPRKRRVTLSSSLREERSADQSMTPKHHWACHATSASDL